LEKKSSEKDSNDDLAPGRNDNSRKVGVRLRGGICAREHESREPWKIVLFHLGASKKTANSEVSGETLEARHEGGGETG